MDHRDELSMFEAAGMADAAEPAWLELIRNGEADAEPVLEEVAGEESDVVRPVDAGSLNLKCGHVGYYGILGRRQPVHDATAIPYRWVCHLLINRRDSNGHVTQVVGTGVLISPKHVLTAAHWIKSAARDARNLWVTYEATSIRVVPGRNGEGTPLGDAFAKSNIKVAAGWNPKAPNLQQDYALIELESPLGDASPSVLGGKKLCYWGSRECPGARVRVVGHGELEQLQGAGGITAGYASPRTSRAQYESRGGITHVNPGSFMRMAAHPWDGGSPVWINVRGEHQLIGLMVKSNVVVRITQAMCAEVRRWVGTDVCAGGAAATTQREGFDEAYGVTDESVFDGEGSAFDAVGESEAVTIDAGFYETGDAFFEASSPSPTRARILWPALGFPAVIAPAGSNDSDAAKAVTLLILSNQRALTSEQVAKQLRCVPWAQRHRRHVAETHFPAKEITVLKPKTSFPTPNPSQAVLVEFGGTGAGAIRASLAAAVTERYAKDLPFLYEIRVSESASAQLANGRYHLLWNNAAEGEDAPSDEMAYLLAHYAREKRAALGPLWATHERYLMDEYEFEYGSLHRPYCSTTAARVRAEILHPLFVDRAGMPTLKIGHLTDLHVDVRADVYEENVRAKEHQLKAKSARQTLSGDETALLNTLGLYNNWNKSVVDLYNDAKQDATAILLTGDLIDYGRGHWGQDAAAHLQANDLYNTDRNWFLFSYLLSSGDAYTKPVYTILGNHDWRINPYPPFAIVGAPGPKNFFYRQRPYLEKVKEEKDLQKWEEKHAAEALRAAHGDGYRRKFSYAAEAEGVLQLLLENTGDAVSALISLMRQKQTMNVKDTPAETTIASVEWYLLAINPFFDYAFTLPNQHRVLMLDWAELEDVLFPIVAGGKPYPYLAWQASEAADPGPKAKNCLTPLQQSLVSGFIALPGPSKVIGIHAPPIGPYPDWKDKDMLEGRVRYDKDKARSARGVTDYVTQKADGTTERWYGHPLFAMKPKSGAEGMTADYGSFQTKREWFIDAVGKEGANVRAVFAGHIHRNGAYVVHPVGAELGPTLAGERLVYRVKTSDAANAANPSVSRTLQGKQGPLYVNTTSAGPNGNYHPVGPWDAKVYPGSARLHLAQNGTIELVQFRKLGAPGGRRSAVPTFAERQEAAPDAAPALAEMAALY